MIRWHEQLRGAAGAVASGALYAWAQPDRGAWPLAVVCLIPLLVVVSGVSLRRRVLLCVLMANVAALVGTSSAAAGGIAAYFELSPWLAAAGWLGLAQILGTLPMLLFSILSGDPGRGHPCAAALRIGAAWITAELMRSVFLSGMPWFLLGYAVSGVPVLLQLAGVGGVLLVSGWLAATNATLARAMAGDARVVAALCAAAVTAGALAFGVASLEFQSSGSARAVQVALVQGPIGEGPRRGAAEAIAEIRRMAEWSASAADVRLVIWPENAANLILPFNAATLRDALRAAPIRAPHLVVGAPVADGTGTGRLYTSAVLLGPERETRGRHDKVKLVPFGEYAPWPFDDWSALPRKTRAGDAVTPLRAGPLSLGPLICYEVLFPRLARAHVEAGATALVNLSNDGWFRHPAALEQHLAAGIYRAVETRRPMLRATRTGVTAAVDASGRVTGRLPVGEEGVLVAQLVPGAARSLYVLGGWMLPWVTAVASMLAAARRRWTAPRTPFPL